MALGPGRELLLVVEVVSGWGSAEGPRAGGERKWVLVFKALENKRLLFFLGNGRSGESSVGSVGKAAALKPQVGAGEVGGGGRFKFRSEVHLLRKGPSSGENEGIRVRNLGERILTKRAD